MKFVPPLHGIKIIIKEKKNFKANVFFSGGESLVAASTRGSFLLGGDNGKNGLSWCECYGYEISHSIKPYVLGQKGKNAWEREVKMVSRVN